MRIETPGPYNLIQAEAITTSPDRQPPLLDEDKLTSAVVAVASDALAPADENDNPMLALSARKFEEINHNNRSLSKGPLFPTHTDQPIPDSLGPEHDVFDDTLSSLDEFGFDLPVVPIPFRIFPIDNSQVANAPSGVNPTASSEFSGVSSEPGFAEANTRNLLSFLERTTQSRRDDSYTALFALHMRPQLSIQPASPQSNS